MRAACSARRLSCRVVAASLVCAWHSVWHAYPSRLSCTRRDGWVLQRMLVGLRAYSACTSAWCHAAPRVTTATPAVAFAVYASTSSCVGAACMSCSACDRVPCMFSASARPSRGASQRAHVVASTTRSCVVSRLRQLQSLVDRQAYGEAAQVFEAAYSTQSPSLSHFCHGVVCDVRDVVLLLMRVFASLGRMSRIRQLLMLCLRDMAAPSRDAATLTSDGACDHRGDGKPGAYRATAALRPRLSVTVFNAYLEVLVMRTTFDKDEVVYVLQAMQAAGVARDALTYHYLIELHVRAGHDVQSLWWQLRRECAQAPLPVTVQTMLLRVVPHCHDAVLAVDVTREALRYGPRVADKRMLTEMLERWLGGSSPRNDAAKQQQQLHNNDNNSDHNDSQRMASGGNGSAADVACGEEADVDDGSSSGGVETMAMPTSTPPPSAAAATATTTASDDADAAAAMSLSPPPLASRFDVPVGHILWLMLEIEVRCVLEVASFTQYVHKSHVAQLLLRCARCGDVGVASSALALMDRHAMTKTADLLALVVWCCAQAGALHDAFDVVELMARRGQLELLDAFRRHTLDCVRHVMERNFLLLLIDAMDSPAVLRDAHAHLRARRQRDGCVSVHSLDLLVAAAARLGEMRWAMRLVAAYTSEWGVAPRTNTYNSLLIGCSTQRGTVLHRGIYAEMRRSGVAPNAQTFRVLIRQAALADHIDDAVAYLNEVAAQQQQLGIRVEVEMLLPLLERASRVGDAATALRISQFSLDCDIGIDAVVMQNAIQRLADAGCAVDELRAHVPLHDALRARSKTGRLRAHCALIL